MTAVVAMAMTTTVIVCVFRVRVACVCVCFCLRLVCAVCLYVFPRRAYNPVAIMQLLGMIMKGLEGLDDHVALVCSNAIDHFATYAFEKKRLDPAKDPCVVSWCLRAGALVLVLVLLTVTLETSCTAAATPRCVRLLSVLATRW